MSRRTLLAAMALLAALDASAQTTTQKIPRVGFCGSFGSWDHVFTKAFVEGMRQRGWVNGKNVRILIQETKEGVTQSCEDYMADKDLDVIVGGGRHDDPNYKVPIVGRLRDVLGTPLATSPTRNITGLTSEREDPMVRDKMMAVLKEATGAEHIFLLYAMPPGPKVKPGIGPADDLPAHVREAARRLSVKIAPVVFTKFEDFAPAFRVIAATPRSAGIFHQGMYWYRIWSDNRGVDWYLHKHRVPVMMPSPDWVQTNDTTPFAYGTSMIEGWGRYSYFVDRILRGAKPAELPFEQLPYRLGLNLDAAKLYGITIPSSVILQADIVVPPAPRFEWAKRESPPGGQEP